MTTSPAPRRPPLWLASAVLACGWGAAYSVALWVFLFTRRPVHEDVRMTYVAAEAGLRYGWYTVYDGNGPRARSSGFSPPGSVPSPRLFLATSPLLAWSVCPRAAVCRP